MTDSIDIMTQLLQILTPLIIGIILFSSTLFSKWRWLVAIVLLVGLISPFIYSLIVERSPSGIVSDKNYEFPMFFAWACSALLAIIGLFRMYLKMKSHKN